MASRNRLPTLVKGNPFTFLVRDSIGGVPVDFAITPLHITIVNTAFRKVLKYIPGGDGNDGAHETPGGVSKVRFSLSAEWTRVTENIPAGDYTVHVRPGGVDGMTAREGKIYSWRVENYEDGEPFSGGA